MLVHTTLQLPAAAARLALTLLQFILLLLVLFRVVRTS
jgi:hypothetical protein